MGSAGDNSMKNNIYNFLLNCVFLKKSSLRLWCEPIFYSIFVGDKIKIFSYFDHLKNKQLTRHIYEKALISVSVLNSDFFDFCDIVRR